MTVSVSSSSITVAATGASFYNFPQIGVAPSNISVLYNGVTLPNTAYTVTLNAPMTGQLWGVGGTVTPTVPANYSTGYLTIARTLPFTQSAAISNQGNQYPIVTEQALDALEFQIQQIAARTGAWRGAWASGVVYNFGDVVQDGINGAYTNNIYVCSQANTSGAWAADLAAGDWQLSISVATLQPPGAFLPLTGGTVSGNLVVSGSVSGGGFAPYALLASPVFTGTPQGPTPTVGDVSTKLATTAFVAANSGGGYITTLNVKMFTANGTYTPSANTAYAIVEMVGGGAGGATVNGGGGSAAGGTTTFGSFLTANGGFATPAGNGVANQGGTVSVSAPAIMISAFQGAGGNKGGGYSVGGNTIDDPSGTGASTPLGGGGAGSQSGTANNGTGYGSGGGGAGGSAGVFQAGAGGAAGGYIRALIPSPTSQPIVIGVGSAGGGSSAGNGASGVVIVTEYINTASTPPAAGLIQSGTAGQIATYAANGTTISGISAYAYFPSVSLYQSTGTVLTISTWVSLGFNQEEYKDAAFTHSTSTNNSQLQVNFTGRVRLSGTIDFGAAGNATYGVRILKNGATVVKNGDNSNGAGGIANIVRQVVLDCACTSGDYFEFQAFTNNASPTSGTGISQTSLSASRIQ